MKKMLAIALAFVFVASLAVVGCPKKDGDPKKDPTKVDPKKDTKAADPKTTTPPVGGTK
jgi:hypothetical protein